MEKRRPYTVAILGRVVMNPDLLTREQALEMALFYRRQVEEAQDRLRRWEAYLELRWGGRDTE